MMRFGKQGKLAPRYIRLYKTVEWVDKVAYKLALLVNMNHIHDVFYVSLLLKYVNDPSHVLRT